LFSTLNVAANVAAYQIRKWHTATTSTCNLRICNFSVK